MTWTEAKSLSRHGIDVGSHTHTHPILARLPLASQVQELATSRAMLEDGLARPIETLAYPVGALNTFNHETRVALARTGYAAAFSHDKSDVNRPGEADRFNILRLSVGGGSSTEMISLRVTASALAGRLVF